MKKDIRSYGYTETEERDGTPGRESIPGEAGI